MDSIADDKAKDMKQVIIKGEQPGTGKTFGS